MLARYVGKYRSIICQRSPILTVLPSTTILLPVSHSDNHYFANMFSFRQTVHHALSSPATAPHSLQLRSLSHWSSLRPQFRPQALPLSTSRRRYASSSENDAGHGAIQAPASPVPQKEAQLQIEPRLSMTFTCTVTDCGHRSSHQFTRRSYEKGIVIVQCPGCQNR